MPNSFDEDEEFENSSNTHLGMEEYLPDGFTTFGHGSSLYSTITVDNIDLNEYVGLKANVNFIGNPPNFSIGQIEIECVKAVAQEGKAGKTSRYIYVEFWNPFSLAIEQMMISEPLVTSGYIRWSKKNSFT
jgi:hypothetical protein